MLLKHLYLRNFRNYEETEIAFSKGINLILGANAQGKTNLLEAIYLVSMGRSFKTQSLEELIRQGSPFFYLQADIEQSQVAQKVQLSFDGQKKQLSIGANSYTSWQPLLGGLPLILYTPQDIELIQGAPAIRRRFLNLHLAQSDPLYVHHLSRFWRAMQQRNCLLRKRETATLEFWEMEMALSGAYLQQARSTMIEELRAPLSEKSQSLSSEKEVHELKYLPSYPASVEGYTKQLQKQRGREMDLGLTLTGPHRDDLQLLIEGKAARFFASEGQKKTCIAALRLAEWERLKQRLGVPPLMGIDDLGLHLDPTRLSALQRELQTLSQVFITTPMTAAASFFTEAHQIQVESGVIKPLSKETYSSKNFK